MIVADVNTEEVPAAHHWARWGAALLILASVIFAALNFADLAAFVDTLRHAQPVWLLAVVALQMGTYGCVALSWKLALEKAGEPVPFRSLLSVALSKLFVDAVVPAAGMGGNLLLVRRLARLGVSRGSAVATLLVAIMGYYSALAILAVVMVLWVWNVGKGSTLLALFVGLFLLVALAIPSCALWLRRRGGHPLPPLLARIPAIRTLFEIVSAASTDLIRDRGLVLRVMLCNAMVLLLDAASLEACMGALGHALPFATAFAAIMAASMAVTLGPMPLGLGSFEAGCTAMLTLLGVPVASALAGTLVLRGFTLWVPLLPGLLLMQKSLTASHTLASSLFRKDE